MKRNVILDFTSLLDVILILLFMVIQSTGTQVSKKADENSKLNEQVSSQQQIIDSNRETLNELENMNSILSSQNAELQGMVDNLKDMQQMTEEKILQYDVFNKYINKIDILCENVDEKCNIIIKNNNQSRIVEIVFDDIKKEKADEIVDILNEYTVSNIPTVITLRYNAYTLHRYEYVIVTDAIDVLQKNMGNKLMYSEASIVNN